MHAPGAVSGLRHGEMSDDLALLGFAIWLAHEGADNNGLRENHGAPDHFAFPVALWLL
jgi:hypothetical protein